MLVSVRLEWDMGHRLPNHGGQCANLHGHRYVAEFMVAGDIVRETGVSDEGMVVDFTHAKRVAKAEVARLDHKFLLQDTDPVLTTIGRATAFALGVVSVPYVPTAENIAGDLLVRCNERCVMEMCGFRFSKLRLYETPTSWVETP